MANTLRPPPRFVPTLTDVVRAPPVADKTIVTAPDVAASARTSALPYPTPVNLAPPATLSTRLGSAIAARAVAPAKPDVVTRAPDKLEDQLVRRVMARVEEALDQRLREATAKVVMEQTRALGPALRREIELAVRLTVAQALAADAGAGDTQPSPDP